MNAERGTIKSGLVCHSAFSVPRLSFLFILAFQSLQSLFSACSSGPGQPKGVVLAVRRSENPVLK
jgi:hypothetical protein